MEADGVVVDVEEAGGVVTVDEVVANPVDEKKMATESRMVEPVVVTRKVVVEVIEPEVEDEVVVADLAVLDGTRTKLERISRMTTLISRMI